MSRLRCGSGALAGAVLVVLLGAFVPSYASYGSATAHVPAESQNACLSQAAQTGASCISSGNGRWTLDSSDSGFGDTGGNGIPGWFVAFAVLVAALGIGTTVWKVSTARNLARRSGLDPNLATGVTLLTDNGLDATYLAASMRDKQAAPAAPGAPARTTSERLADLSSLLAQGAITQVEYEERRKAIIDSV